MERSKYIFFNEGQFYFANSIKEIAEKFFDLKVERLEDGNWGVFINNKHVTSYYSKQTKKEEGWTRSEAKRDYLTLFRPYVYNKNCAIYRLA